MTTMVRQEECGRRNASFRMAQDVVRSDIFMLALLLGRSRDNPSRATMRARRDASALGSQEWNLSNACLISFLLFLEDLFESRANLLFDCGPTSHEHTCYPTGRIDDDGLRNR